MRVRKGDRIWSEEYQRVIIVAEYGKLENSRHHYIVDTSGIIYKAASWVPFPYPMMEVSSLATE